MLDQQVVQQTNIFEPQSRHVQVINMFLRKQKINVKIADTENNR